MDASALLSFSRFRPGTNAEATNCAALISFSAHARSRPFARESSPPTPRGDRPRLRPAAASAESRHIGPPPRRARRRSSRRRRTARRRRRAPRGRRRPTPCTLRRRRARSSRRPRAGAPPWAPRPERAVGERRERQRALRGGHGLRGERRPEKRGRGDERRQAQHLRRTALLAVARAPAGDSAERAHAHDATPAVATPMEAPCEYSSVAACDMTISPALTPKPSVAHSVTIAGLSCVSIPFLVAQRDAVAPRGDARGASSPPALSRVQGRRREHQRAHRCHRAADVGDVQQVAHDGHEEERARGSRGRHETDGQALAERRGGVDLHGQAVADAGGGAEHRAASSTNSGVTETTVTACAATSMPIPVAAAAAAAMVFGFRREYSAGPSLATATVKATVVTENTHDSTPRPTPNACSNGTRKHDQQYTLPSNTFKEMAPKNANGSFSVSKRGANRSARFSVFVSLSSRGFHSRLARASSTLVSARAVLGFVVRRVRRRGRRDIETRVSPDR